MVAGSFGKAKCPKMSDIGIRETHLAKNIQSVHIHHYGYHIIKIIIIITDVGHRPVFLAVDAD